MTDADQRDQDGAPTQLQELAVMAVIAGELNKLDAPAIARVLRWAADAFKTKAGMFVSDMTTATSEVSTSAPALKPQYDSLADFYSAASPTQANDKALLIGYWLQVLQDGGDFDAQSVNKELKHLGHGVANITSAFDSLMARKPQLVIQTKKSGTSRQARKLYRLTLEGQRAVERMLSGNE